MDAHPPTSAGLPPGARRLVALVGGLAVLLVAAVVAVAGPAVDLWAVLLIAALIAGGELLAIDLSFRRGGVMSFSLSDTALTAGFLLVGGLDVVLAGTLAVVGLQMIERLPAHKQVFNVAQTVAGFATAALVVELLTPPSAPVDARSVAATALGIALLSLVNSAAVGGMVALTSGQGWLGVVRRLLPTATLLVAGNLCLGLIVVLLLDSDPWALPALAVPIVLLHRASRGEVRAQVGRERAQEHLLIEQQLSEARDPAAVAVILARGVSDLLGVSAAVWHGGAWATPVPSGSRPCPVDADLATTLVTAGPVLGPAFAGPCAAMGLGSGVLVIWANDLRMDDDAQDWLERLARSGRLHLARATAAAALAKEQAALRAVVDGTADGICMVDTDGDVAVWNPAMAAISGVAADDAIGRPAGEVLGDGPWDRAGVHDVVRPDDRVWRVAVSSPRTSGSRRVAVVHDVSAERRVARMKDDMLAVVSHELRTPLTPIKASAQLLLLRWDRLGVDQRNGLLAQVASSADHLNRLVNDLLLVAQLSASATSRPRVALEPVDLVEAVAEAADALRLTHPGHRITQLGPAHLPTLTDTLRLRQIIDNLVTNACKFSPAGSQVDIALVEAGTSVVLSVRDHGRGIPPEDLVRVFERFERVEDPLVMTTSGVGLGLYIVRELVTAMGGEISLHSEVGVGTTAQVTLPLLSPRLGCPSDAPDALLPAAEVR